MSNTNAKTLCMFFVATAILLGATMMANAIHQVNAQGNATNATDGGQAVVAVVEIDPLIKALQEKYPKLAELKEDKDLVEAVKTLEDTKEAAKIIVGFNLLRDLAQFKALEALD
jgi:hypothetical protein